MITTFTGKTVDPLNLKEEDICIEDIAHSLALINRFNGHSRFPISVAQHSVYVSRIAVDHELEGLLHDAAEAYIGDMTKWVKHSPHMVEYRKIESQIEKVIFKKFGIVELDHVVSEADEIMVRFEARKAFGNSFNFGGNIEKYPPITNGESKRIGLWAPWKWTVAEEVFLGTYRSLI